MNYLLLQGLEISSVTDEVPLMVMSLHIANPAALSFQKDSKAVIHKLKLSCFLKPIMVVNWYDSKLYIENEQLNVIFKSQISVPWKHYFRVSNIISGKHSFSLLFTQNGITRPVAVKSVYPVLPNQA